MISTKSLRTNAAVERCLHVLDRAPLSGVRQFC